MHIPSRQFAGTAKESQSLFCVQPPVVDEVDEVEVVVHVLD